MTVPEIASPRKRQRRETLAAKASSTVRATKTPEREAAPDGHSEPVVPVASAPSPSAGQGRSSQPQANGASAKTASQTVFQVRAYLDMGLGVVPINRSTKELYDAKHYNYSNPFNAKLPDASLSIAFGGKNVGVVNGSGGLVDLDLDWPEARVFGDILLKDYAGFGRKSSPRSHRLVRIDSPRKLYKFSLPFTDEQLGELGWPRGSHATTIAEFRSSGGHTNFPPSVHPSGEVSAWSPGDDIAKAMRVTVPHDEAYRKLGAVAALALLSRFYPGEGSRQDYCRAIVGALTIAGIEPELIVQCVTALATLKGDDEARDRANSVRSTVEKVENDEPVTGIKAICEIIAVAHPRVIADAVGRALRKWLPKPKSDDELCIDALAKLTHLEYEGKREDACAELKLKGRDKLKRLDALVQVARDSQQALDNPEYMMELDDARDYMNSRIAIIDNIGTKTKVLAYETTELSNHPLPIYQSISDIAVQFENKRIVGQKGSIFDNWRKDAGRRQYKGVVFDPSNPGDVDGKLNLWTGFNYTGKAGNWELMQKHIYEILSREQQDHYDYLIKWLAWKIQNPGLQPDTVPVYIGGIGSGKTMVFAEYLKLWGRHGLTLSKSEHLTGRFNSHAQDRAVILLNEAFVAEDVKAKNALKALITDDTIVIEPKGLQAFEITNRLGIIFTGNDPDAVPADPGERRYFMNTTRDTYVRGNVDEAARKAYFTPIFEQMLNGGREAMLFDLQTMPLMDFKPRDDMPRGDALFDAMRRKLSLTREIVLDALHRGHIAGHIPKKPNHVRISDLKGILEHSEPKIKGVSNQKIADTFKEFGATSVTVQGKPRWVFPDLREARAIFDRGFGKQEWDTTIDNWLEDQRGCIADDLR